MIPRYRKHVEYWNLLLPTLIGTTHLHEERFIICPHGAVGHQHAESFKRGVSSEAHNTPPPSSPEHCSAMSKKFD